MAYLTVAQAVASSRASWSTRTIAESQMTKSAAAPMTTNFDIFLSHAHEDAEVVAAVKVLIEGEGLSVYVDWIKMPRRTEVKSLPKQPTCFESA